MNIWSLSKHKTIKLLVFKLQQYMGHSTFVIPEADETDPLSIELVKANQSQVRAYIYTHGQSQDRYGIHLEYPWYVENEFNDAVLVYEDLSMSQVINTLATHFEVSQLEMAV